MRFSKFSRVTFLALIFIYSCADVSEAGKRVYLVEVDGNIADMRKTAEKMMAKYGCADLGFLHAQASYFPPSYSVHENEIHAALRNRGATVGANVVIGNFYQRPATGIGLKCDDEIMKELLSENRP